MSVFAAIRRRTAGAGLFKWRSDLGQTDRVDDLDTVDNRGTTDGPREWSPALRWEEPPQGPVVVLLDQTRLPAAEVEQAVPIAITALNQDDLNKLDIRTIEDIKYVAPSVYIAPTTFRQAALGRLS